jgi:YHS domain-containing protein
MRSTQPHESRPSTRRRIAVAATVVVSVALSLVAATQRFGDSAHAMGMISSQGGRARHPVELPEGGTRCMLVVTATVIPPFRGDVSVVVEGDPAPEFTVRASAPVIDLGLGRTPRFDEGAFRDLQPGDRLAMWIAVKPPPLDPVCGHPRSDGFLTAEHDGQNLWFCSEGCRAAFLADPNRAVVRGKLAGSHRIVFRDLASGNPVLTIPLVFGSGGGHGHDH